MLTAMPRVAVTLQREKKSNLAAVCGGRCHYQDADAMLETYCATLHEILKKEQ